MIVLDLEWNRGYDKKPLDEILQIGAVRVDRPGGAITDTFNVYIRPRIHKRFDRGAKKLPELPECRASDMTFRHGFELFRAWCAGETEFGGWGTDDFRTLERNCAFHEVVPMKMETVIDIQKAYARVVGAGNTQIALWRAVDYCGIPDIHSYHNALNDAVYTALLAQWLTEEELRYVPPPPEPKPAPKPRGAEVGDKPRRRRRRRSRRKKTVQAAAPAVQESAAENV